MFRDGKIVKATSSTTAKLNEVLDSDQGARYVGEFAIGFNPYCTTADEGHSLRREDRRQHPLHPRPCYDEASNGNKSDITGTWCCARPGSRRRGDVVRRKLVRKDGRFVVAELEGLNPESLK